MNKNIKKGIVILLGGAGFIALLIPIFTNKYSFSWGLIAAIAIWIVTFAVSTMMGLRSDK